MTEAPAIDQTSRPLQVKEKRTVYPGFFLVKECKRGGGQGNLWREVIENTFYGEGNLWKHR